VHRASHRARRISAANHEIMGIIAGTPSQFLGLLTFILYLFTLCMTVQGLMLQTNDNRSRDLFPGALEIMILELLRRQPAHGYALVQHIQQRSNNLLQVEEGSLYPAPAAIVEGETCPGGVDSFVNNESSCAHVPNH
jgi:Transcriptional regulator PadR-like family